MLSVLSPLWLLLLPLAGGLLTYAYMRKGSAAKKKVSSLFFIRQLRPADLPGRSKLRLPWRMILELLVLASLVLLLAGLSWRQNSRNIVMLLDNSLSMGGLIEPGTSERTYLDEAKRSALSTLDLNFGPASVEVWVTSPNLHSLSGEAQSVTDAKQKISEVGTSFAGDELETALAELPAMADSVFIFTDRVAENPEAQARFRFVPLTQGPAVRQNITVRDLAVERAVQEGGSDAVRVGLSTAMTDEAVCTLTVHGLKEQRWSELQKRRVLISKDEVVTFSASLVGVTAIKAQLQACDSPVSNGLHLDDVRWLALSGSQTALTVISEYSAQELGLRNLAAGSVRVLTPAKAEAGIAADASDGTLIFHRSAPATLPKRNTLFIDPPAAWKLLPSSAQTAKVAFSRWEEAHPILRYLQLPSEVHDLRTFEAIPEWLSPLMYSSRGVVGLQGIIDSHRYAAFSFELLPFEGRKNPFSSILLLNTLSWLSSSGSDDNALTLLPIIKRSREEVVSPIDSAIQGIRLPETANEKLYPPSTGLYRIKGTTERLEAVNYYNLKESDLLSRAGLRVPAETGQSQRLEKGVSSLGLYLLMAAAVLVFLDLMITALRLLLVRRSSDAL